MNVEKQANASICEGRVYKKGAERTFIPDPVSFIHMIGEVIEADPGRR
jgi:hypothetical protein